MSDIRQPVYGATADRLRDQLREPSDLDTAIRVAQQMLAHYGDSSRDGFSYPEAYGAQREALRLLLRALGAEALSRVEQRAGMPASGGEPIRTCHGQCQRCGHAFDPSDTRFDGHGRYRNTVFCRSCVDNCHEGSAEHVCVICDPKRYGGEVR